MREWVRGRLPLVDPKEDRVGARFYRHESVPMEEWSAENLEEMMRVHAGWEAVEQAVEAAAKVAEARTAAEREATGEPEPPKPKRRGERKDAR
jgi:hypothetical protein